MIDHILSFAIGITCGVALGVLLDEGIHHLHENKEDVSVASEPVTCCGEPICMDYLALEQIREIAKAREEWIAKGHELLIAKATSGMLRNCPLHLPRHTSPDHLMIIAVTDPAKNTEDAFTEGMLIRYKELDPALEKALAQADGCMVVTA